MIFEPQARQLQLEDLKLTARGLGEFEASLDIGHLPEDMTLPSSLFDLLKYAKQFEKVLIHGGQVSYRDHSAVNRFFDLALEEERRSRSNLGEKMWFVELKDELNGSMSRAGGDTTLEGAWFSGLLAYVDGKEQIAISISPGSPVPVGRLMRSGSDKPGLLKLLGAQLVTTGNRDMGHFAMTPEEEREARAEIKIASLLAQASTDLEASRLMDPIGRNAYDKYREILTLQPEHSGAEQGITRVAERYRKFSERALARGDKTKAAIYFERATKLRPSLEGLETLEKRLANVLAERKRRFMEAVRKAGNPWEDPFDAAIYIADMLDPGSWQVRLLGEIANLMVKVGQVEEANRVFSQAKKVANSVKDQEEKSSSLSNIARALAEAGMAEKASSFYSQAINITSSIKNKERKIDRLSSLAVELAKTGMLKEARDAFSQAMSIANSIKGQRGAADTIFNNITARLIETGMIEKAMDAVRSITDRWYAKGHLLSEIAKALAKAGMVEKAVSVADSFEDRSKKNSALSGIATGLAEAGKVEKAVDVANSFKARAQKSAVLSDVSVTLAEAGRIEEAMDVANSIQDQLKKSLALRSIAEALSKVGRTEKAMNVTNSIKDQGQKSYALSDVVGAFTKAGQVEKAMDVANSIKDQYQKGYALSGVARAFAMAGQNEKASRVFSRVIEIARSAKDQDIKNYLLLDVSNALSETGSYSKSIDITNLIKDEYIKDQALDKIAGALAKTGRLKEAVNLANTTKDYKSIALYTIAETVAKQAAELPQEERSQYANAVMKSLSR